MKSSAGKSLWLPAAALLVILCAVGLWWGNSQRFPPADPNLAQFVAAHPRYPVVFTSRTQPASLRAAADEGEQFVYPGKPLWQAQEGRLRLLTPSGGVSELTWGKQLPDGATLIDVMSPSVSADGTKIVFAARKAAPDAGHFRIYEIGVDGQQLRQITGGPDDLGATKVPPMRFAADGHTRLSDGQRQQVDYDDVDPTYAPGGHIVFASSRQPDLGRDHARRSTTLWIMQTDGSDKRPLSANRNNDRWPWIASNGYVIFSLWSRNREVVAGDLASIVPYEAGVETATSPTDNWIGAHIEPNADYFGAVLKTREPVWRPRGLLNGNYAFMTPRASEDVDLDSQPDLTVVQAQPGVVATAPSSLATGSSLPLSQEANVIAGPTVDAQGRPLRLACPSPCPPDQILLSAATPDDDGQWQAGRYGLYIADQNWPAKDITAASVHLTKLFDDPSFVDAEPVAVYPREIDYEFHSLEQGDGSATVNLADGKTYNGPTALVRNSAIYRQNNLDSPGQTAELGESPIYNAVPQKGIESIRVYASHRDRFDDPDVARIPGPFEMLLETPVMQDSFEFRAPPGAPTVLAGFDAAGRVVHWNGVAKDQNGEFPQFFAFAGDHYSGARPGFTHFCTGCHTGHSGTPTLRLPSDK